MIKVTACAKVAQQRQRRASNGRDGSQLRVGKMVRLREHGREDMVRTFQLGDCKYVTISVSNAADVASAQGRSATASFRICDAIRDGA